MTFPIAPASAWQWWHSRLSLHPHHHAETIRNTLLQDCCALKGALEYSLNGQQPPNVGHLDSWLKQLEKMYIQLKSTGDQLSPPQSENLTLALRHQLDLWRLQHPKLSVAFEGKNLGGSQHLNETILFVLLEWLRMSGCQSARHLDVQLYRDQSEQVLELCMKYASSRPPIRSAPALLEVRYLKEIFSHLTQGSYVEQHFSGGTDQSIKGTFRWHAWVGEEEKSVQRSKCHTIPMPSTLAS